MSSANFLVDRRQMLAAMTLLGASPTSAFSQDPSEPEFLSIKKLAGAFADRHRLANIVVAVGRKGVFPHFHSIGQLDWDGGPPAGPDTLFRIASMTKPITACAMMLLIEQGILGLDTPLAEIFPEFGEMRVLTNPQNSEETAPATRPITIRHLLTHTAGFTYGGSGPAYLDSLYEAEGLSIWRRTPPEAAPNASPSLLGFARAAAELPLLFEPGSRWNYSIGLDIAGAAIEQVSGVPFEAFLQRALFDPLGMRDTFFTVPADKIDRLAASYEHTSKGPKLLERGNASSLVYPPAAPSGGGGLISTARDYAEFAEMLLNGGQHATKAIMQPGTVRLMMSNLLEPGVVANTGFGPSGYGAGGRSTLAAIPGGEGAGTFGWMGSHQTNFFVDPQHDVFLVIMTQLRRWWPNPIHDEFSKALYADISSMDAG